MVSASLVNSSYRAARQLRTAPVPAEPRRAPKGQLLRR